jgi:integrase
MTTVAVDSVSAAAIADPGPGTSSDRPSLALSWAELAEYAHDAARSGGCTRPVRLKGHLDAVDLATGERRTMYDTAAEPGGVLLMPCGNRRESVCPPCSQVYKQDARQLVRAGLTGGKGVPETVAGHPCVFATFTAPSFGPVHSRRMRGKTVLPCRPRRDHKERRCPHGRMSVSDRWHNNKPGPGDIPCKEHSRGNTKLYPTAEHLRGDRWLVRWRSESGEQLKRSFPRRSGRDPETSAEAFDAQRHADEARGEWIDPRIGRTPFQIKDLQSIKVLAPSTIETIYVIFASIMRGAVRDGYIRKTPCVDIRLPEISKTAVRLLTPAQVLPLAQAMPQRYALLVLLGAGAGLRQGEAFGLALDRIAGDVLCRTPRGTLLRRDYCNREIWKPAIAATGLPADTTFHDLRHTFASTALAEGVPISEVSRWLGHKSIITTVDLYGHLVPEASGRARDTLDHAFRLARMCPQSAPAAP